MTAWEDTLLKYLKCGGCAHGGDRFPAVPRAQGSVLSAQSPDMYVAPNRITVPCGMEYGV